MKKLLTILGLVIIGAGTLAFVQDFARRVFPIFGTPTICSENQIFYEMLSHRLMVCDGTNSIKSVAFMGEAGISLNGLVAGTQTFAVGTSGTNFNISSVGTVHTFNFPNASDINRGLLLAADWATFNEKQLNLGLTTKSGSGVTAIGATLTSLTNDDCLKWNGTNWINSATCGSGGGAVTSIFGRVGVVTANVDDYSFAQIAGSLTDSQVPDSITINSSLVALVANSGDSATNFFTTGTFIGARVVTGAITNDKCLKTDGSGNIIEAAADCNTSGGSGTVTSFSAGDLTPLFTTSEATVTTTPALTFSLSTQLANLVFAGPVSGGALAPTFRSLVDDDIPNTITLTAFSQIGGNIIDSQVPDNITINLSTVATTATLGDNATLFFSAGTIEPARILTGTITNSRCIRVDSSGNIMIHSADCGGAPTDAPYITQTTNGGLSAEQALSILATGIVKNTTTTGVLSIATAGTDYLTPSSAATITAVYGFNDGKLRVIGGAYGVNNETVPAVVARTFLYNTDNKELLFGRDDGTSWDHFFISGVTTVNLGSPNVSGDLPFASLAQASAVSVLLGRGSASGIGDFQEITLGTNLTMTGTVLSATGGAGSGTITAGVTDFIPKYIGATTIDDSLLSDNGTTLVYTGTGGITAASFTTEGLGTTILEFLEGAAPSPALTSNSFLIYAPVDVPVGGLAYVLPNTAASGIIHVINSSGTMTQSISGIVIADLTASGTPSSTTFLRGDNSWAVPAGGGDMLFAGAGTNTALKTFNDLTFKIAGADYGASDESRPAVAIGTVIRNTNAGSKRWFVGIDDTVDFWGEILIAGVSGPISMALGGLGVALTDPNADRILFWDDSAGAYAYLSLGTNLLITGTTLDATGGGGVSDGDKGDITVTASGATWTIDTGLNAAKIGGGGVSTAEFDFIGTLSSNAQTQLDTKAPLASPTFTGTVTIPTPFTLGAVSVLPTGTELNFVDGVTSAIQTQLDDKQPLDSDLTAIAASSSSGFYVRTGNGFAGIRTIVGTTNEITVSNGDGVSANPTLALATVIDLSGKTSFAIPNAAAPTVDAFGEIAGDSNLWATSRGAPVFFDGTAAVGLIGALVSDVPTNGQVPVWNTGGTITWETVGGSGTVTSVSVTTANGVSGSVDTATTTPAITLTLGAITPTTVNGNTITTGTGTLTLATGKTLTASNTLTFTGTDASSVAFGAGGTVAYIGLANAWADGVKQTFNPDATNAGFNYGSLAGNPSSLVNGDAWYNSTTETARNYAGGLPGTYVRTISSQTSTTDTLTASTISTTETNFATNFAIPANYLKAGKSFRLTAAFQGTSSSSPPTHTLRVKTGTTVLYLGQAFTAPASQTNLGNAISFDLVCTATGASGTLEIQPIAPGGGTTIMRITQNTTVQPVTVDTTGSLTLQLSLQYSAATAGNSFTLRHFVLEELN